ncbi:MAG: hypothetical protein RIC19_05850 [Phaeodactylibacter sp.]|uniref:hypothetical protein n=1 Tax=Phaeodactylibacter sp. TaxID=1940289 RepID=UPI0032EAFFA4
MNRVIDGVDLDGLEWKSNHKWNDVIGDRELQNIYGTETAGRKSYSIMGIQIYSRRVQAWEIHQGKTYVDLWQESVRGIQNRYFNEGTRIDCANFCFQVLTEFAYNHSLPIYIDDFKGEDTDPTFSNDAYGFTDPTSGKFTQFEEGDWQGFASKIGLYYGGPDIWSRYSKFTTTKASLWKGDGSMEFTGAQTKLSHSHKIVYL